MTDIEKKARALLDEVKRVKNLPGATYTDAYRALCRAIEQHEAFRQEVSEALLWHCKYTDGVLEGLQHLIIAKPDPLVEAWREAWPNDPLEAAEKETQALRAAIAKRGGKIVWENSDA